MTIDLVNLDNGVKKTGAIIKDGTITPYTKLDLTGFLEDLNKYKETYTPHKNMHHVASIPFDVIEHIRIEKKYPQGRDGFNLALKDAIKMVQTGELSAFRVHGD